MVKMEFHFFVLFLKEIRTKIFIFKDFLYFFNSAHFSLFKGIVQRILTGVNTMLK
jgi:hypothetical protein